MIHLLAWMPARARCTLRGAPVSDSPTYLLHHTLEPLVSEVPDPDVSTYSQWQ